MKDAENLVAKEERLLRMFAISMAPETDAFNKTTWINYLILAKGELWCLLRLRIWNCDEPRLKVEFSADKRQITCSNPPQHPTSSIWQRLGSAWRCFSHSILPPKALEKVQISSEGVGEPALANLLFGKRQWLSLSRVCSSPTGWPELNAFLSLFFQLI